MLAIRVLGHRPNARDLAAAGQDVGLGRPMPIGAGLGTGTRCASASRRPLIPVGKRWGSRHKPHRPISLQAARASAEPLTESCCWRSWAMVKITSPNPPRRTAQMLTHHWHGKSPSKKTVRGRDYTRHRFQHGSGSRSARTACPRRRPLCMPVAATSQKWHHDPRNE